ncbi:metal-dependent hydrolase [Pseudomonas sp. NW5]|uniref:metal-dependent hydrolase n=1 Tax=Pseudomonas sp. NW5 TaxID=2934934 RepID=UPI0020207CBB|nr:metal-dependent hydrolase [Pseudomonas sp. NW5]MCL7461599.1 metal-dependent hydrolase [Pseudomonas sp. NW5]
MMVYTHLVSGFFAGTGLVSYLDLRGWELVGLLAGATAGALLPDIDHPKSWLGRRLPFISRPIAAVFGHRGITHSLLAVVGLALALHYGWAHGYVGSDEWGLVAVGLTVGYLSHILGDFLTHGGVPLFWPLKRRFSAPLTFQTGGVFERFLMVALLGGSFWQLMTHFVPGYARAMLHHLAALTADALST